MVGIPPMKIVILGMDGLWHLVYHMNLPLNPTLSPSFEIGQEWQYLPRWGAPNRGKKTWNCWWKSDLYHYFGIYPTTTHNMYTYWCDSLSLSVPSPPVFPNHDFFTAQENAQAAWLLQCDPEEAVKKWILGRLSQMETEKFLTSKLMSFVYYVFLGFRRAI